MALEETGPVIANWEQLAAERGWSDEVTADNLERLNDPTLAAHFRAKAAAAGTTDRATAPKGRRAKADDSATA